MILGLSAFLEPTGSLSLPLTESLLQPQMEPFPAPKQPLSDLPAVGQEEPEPM